jgi:hypothetical protein
VGVEAPGGQLPGSLLSEGVGRQALQLQILAGEKERSRLATALRFGCSQCPTIARGGWGSICAR